MNNQKPATLKTIILLQRDFRFQLFYATQKLKFYKIPGSHKLPVIMNSQFTAGTKTSLRTLGTNETFLLGHFLLFAHHWLQHKEQPIRASAPRTKRESENERDDATRRQVADVFTNVNLIKMPNSIEKFA